MAFKNKETPYSELMMKGSKNIDYFKRITQVKDLLANSIVGMNDREIRSALCHCWYYKFGRRKY